jgi:hypothetical protein
MTLCSAIVTSCTRSNLCREFLGKIWSDSLVHDDKALKLLVDILGCVCSCFTHLLFVMLDRIA